MDTKYAVIDIETTGGLPRRDKIIEVGIIVHDGRHELDRYESLIDPGISIPPQITRLTGITTDMVAGAPKFHEVARRIVELTKDAVFVAHNVRFDYNFIREEFARLGYTFTRKQLCTKRLARKSIEGLRSYSLESLIHYFGISVKNRHRALDDAYAASEVLQKVLFNEENRSITWDLIHQGVKEARLPASLSLEYLHQMPEDCGIYFFHNEAGDVIYVGKSKNIKDRILQHFADHTEKATVLQQMVHSISYEILGSELLALLRENEEIKKIKPEINRQLRKKELPYGLYHWIDENGYYRYSFEKIKEESADPEWTLVKRFHGPNPVKAYLTAAAERNQLCPKLLELEKPGGACFHYHVGTCAGACLGLESYESYNQRAKQVLGKSAPIAEDFIIQEVGRAPDEVCLLWIRNGRCIGYQYKSELDQVPVDEWSFQKLATDEDAGIILRHYLAKNKVLRRPRALFG
jgi:DNA polymerase III subunit epsilon